MNLKQWLAELLIKKNKQPQSKHAAEFCPSNIALIKYWGKRDVEFNLPTHSSLSISLGDKGAHCSIDISTDDAIIVNADKLDPKEKHFARIIAFVNLICSTDRQKLKICFTVNIPIAAGLASSACIFASLTQALNKLYDWNLSNKQLSILARIGSGSAARSVYDGFVIWHRGNEEDGSDSFAEPIDCTWPELRIGLLINTVEKKKISSSKAMQDTCNTNPNFNSYVTASEQIQLPSMLLALKNKDFSALGDIAEKNAAAMHATMHQSQPPINYDNITTKRDKKSVIAARDSGIEVYYTQDAGPNLKILFLEKDTSSIIKIFPECQIIKPFA